MASRTRNGELGYCVPGTELATIVVLVGMGLMAGSNTHADTRTSASGGAGFGANNSGLSNSRSKMVPEALGDLLFTHDIESVTTPPADASVGVQYTNGFFWVTGRSTTDNVKKLYKLNSSGGFVAAYAQDSCPSSTLGWRDLAFDGTYLWAGDECGVDKIDPNTGSRVGGFANPPGVALVNALAYDPSTLQFYTANSNTAITVFSTSGAVVRTMPANGLAHQGFGWDSLSPGGPYLWSWSQNNVSGNCSTAPCIRATRLNPANGSTTGLQFDGQSAGSRDLAGGADVVAGLAVPLELVTLQQGAPAPTHDTIRGYDLALVVAATYTPQPTPTATNTSQLTSTALPTYTPINTANPTHTAIPTTTGTVIGTMGPIAFTSAQGSNSEIYRMNIDGSNQRNITNHPSRDAFPAWSPDSSKIAFLSSRDGGSYLEIYVMNADGSNVVRLTNNTMQEFGPLTWSPDGTKIAFSSYPIGDAEIFVMNADGSNQINLTNSPMDDFEPNWAPDGSRIAFTSERSSRDHIYVMNADGSNQIPLTNNLAGGNQWPSWSPDGSKIAYHSQEDAYPYNNDIFVMNADGSGRVNLTNSVYQDDQPGWSPDGSRIVFSSFRDGHSEIYVMNSNGSNQSRLTNNPQGNFHPAWQPRPSPKVLVQNEEGTPVAGAEVYRNCILIGTTNAQGILSLRGASQGDHLVARKLVYTGPTDKGSHDDWAYHVWVTSITQEDDGNQTTFTITDTSQITQTLAITRTNSQIGFNIVASVEYNASDEALGEISEGLRSASKYLFDVSDGQMLFEKITLYEDKENWRDADYQFRAFHPRANADTHSDGISALTGTCCHIRAQGSDDYGVSWNQPSAFSTLIHEFGHYAIGAYDEYYSTDQQTTSSCTLDRGSVDYDYRASIMANHEDSSEFCNDQNHNPNTSHGLLTGTSVWGTLVDNWSDSQGRWSLRSPMTRQAVDPGPFSLPCMNEVTPTIVSSPSAACGPIDTRLVFGNVFIEGEDINLNHKGHIIHEGKTDSVGHMLVHGAAAGDSIVVDTFDPYRAHGSVTITSCHNLPYLLIPLTHDSSPRYGLNPPPQMDWAQNRVDFWLDFDADPGVVPVVYGSQDGEPRQQISLSYDPVNVRFAGSYSFDPLLNSIFTLEVEVQDANGVPFLDIFYMEGEEFLAGGPSPGGDGPNMSSTHKLPGASSPTSWELFPPESEVGLRVGPNSLPDGTGVLVGETKALVGAPTNLLLVGGPYSVQGQNPLSGEAGLSLDYQSEYFCGLQTGATSIYRYTGSTWEALPTTLIEEWHLASTTISQWGIYAVFARPNPQVAFSDVPVESTFYGYIGWMTCHGIASGYADSTFRPGSNATRGQISKMISLAYQWHLEPPGGGLARAAEAQGAIFWKGKGAGGQSYTFTDVPPGSTFYLYIEATYREGAVSGYPCGGTGEPCDPRNRPYFRPSSNVTRGQIAKIISNGSRFGEVVSGQAFEDVVPGSTFYEFVERMASRGIVNGYDCGGTGEPCGGGDRPYFRPQSNATRGQLSKMIYFAVQPR